MTDMGDLFNQRRAARKNQQPPPSSSTNTGRSEPSEQQAPRRSSFLDIQAEQEREQQRASAAQPRYSNNRGGGDYYGGGSDNYRGGGRSDNYGYGGGRSDNYGGGRNDRYGSGSRGDDYGRNRGGGYSQQRGPDVSTMPLEQGLVSSLKENFGFIYCADRPEELFFHYSQVQGCHASDLVMDTEVEFRVGPSARDHDKMAAYEVRVLEPGTIVWETEDEPDKRFRGIVERPVRSERGSNQVAEGTIRMLVQDEEEEKADEKEGVLSTGAPLVRFTANDYTPAADTTRTFRRTDSTGSASSRGSGRLGRGDLVEFSLVTQRRTGTKGARSITLIQSERERQRLEKEKELLANATLEQGVVTTLKNEFGFLRSNKRREEVYFHFSNVSLPEGEDGEAEAVLKEGQDMEFLVVTEPGTGGRKDKLSARKLKFRPSGSVVFHTEVAQGVTGIITRCPHPVDSSYVDEMVGRVQLTKPITQQNEDGSETTVSEVVFKAADAPGGSYAANRDGSSVGLWVKEGDTLLFDVVKELVDDSYCASPTKHIRPKVGDSETSEEAPEGTEKVIRMVSLSLAGRAEGVVHALKDNYGFISCVERPVDTYFRFYEILPDEIQNELRLNMGLSETDGKKPALAVGAEVQFDLSLQGMVPSTNSRSRRGGQGAQGEKESLKAQRILVLPPSTITQTKVLAKDVKGVVSKEDPKQSYAGTIELEEELKSMSLEELHPLVTKLVDSMLAKDAPTRSVIFPDLQSTKEDQIVVKMVDVRGNGELECSYIPAAKADATHPGRLCIKRVDKKDTEPKNDENNSENSGAEPAEKGLSSELVKEGDESGEKSTKTLPKPKHPKKKKSEKIVKMVRFDKHCLAKELQNGMPLGKDDVVICDVVQSRRSGMVSLANVRVVERKMIERGVSLVSEDSTEKSSGVGIVTEVVPSRQFGFISVVDEDASKRELLFFHTSSVVVDEGASHSPTKSRSSKCNIRKDDEVRFDVGTGRNGKRVATNIRVVPPGTLNIPKTAEKNACRGLVLMEPSHTSLANTPLRHSRHGPGSQGKSPGAGSGRWDNVGTEELTRTASGSSVKEEGSILLLSDPANVFGRKGKAKREQNNSSTSGSDNGGEASESTNAEDAEEGNGENQGEAKISVSASRESSVCRHLSYKNGGLAVHGPGSSSSADKSTAPRRGDLVSFIKAKNGKGIRDIRLVTRGAATRVRGRLENISLSASDGEQELGSPGTAKFVAATEKEEVYTIDLSEVVSCDPTILKENVTVEGILHDSQIHGVCRTTDLYLESKLGPSHKERPRLNLTVRKELTNRGGKIMAQSMMAKGPDGTNGFAAGWSNRVSPYAAASKTEETNGSEDTLPEELGGAAVDSAEPLVAE